jgi:hypothetical protein
MSSEPLWDLTAILAVPIQVQAANQTEAFEQAREGIYEAVRNGGYEVDCIEVHSVSKPTD